MHQTENDVSLERYLCCERETVSSIDVWGMMYDGRKMCCQEVIVLALLEHREEVSDIARHLNVK